MASGFSRSCHPITTAGGSASWRPRTECRSKSSRKCRPVGGGRESGLTDVVKRQVAAHWNRRAPSFDEDFGHSIRTPAERAAWDRIFALVLADRRQLDALDVGCGTGFLTFDFATAMIAEARRKATERPGSVRFEEGDAEQLPFARGSFDVVMTRHVLWTL